MTQECRNSEEPERPRAPLDGSPPTIRCRVRASSPRQFDASVALQPVSAAREPLPVRWPREGRGGSESAPVTCSNFSDGRLDHEERRREPAPKTCALFGQWAWRTHAGLSPLVRPIAGSLRVRPDTIVPERRSPRVKSASTL